MKIFNSLGSNYRFKTGAYALFADKKSPAKLRNYLKERYKSPTVQLTYKGREAITLAFNSLNLPQNSYVAVSGYTCYAVYQAITAANLLPYYLDIEKDDLNFSATTLEKAFQQPLNIKAVMIQNTFGIPADIEAIKKACDQNQAVLIEDLAHCIGLIYSNGSEAGTLGTAAALSFSQDKMIDAVCGGAVVFKSAIDLPAVDQPAGLGHRLKTRLYPWLTFKIRLTFPIGLGRLILKISKVLKLLPGPMGGEADPAHQLPAWHSQLALKSYQNLEAAIKHRQNIAAVYRRKLPAEIQFNHYDEAVYLRFPIKVNKPLELIEFLKKFGIYLGDRWYDAPVAPKRFLDKTNYKEGSCPNAEKAAEQMVNLPTHVHISEARAQQIAERINQWLES